MYLREFIQRKHVRKITCAVIVLVFLSWLIFGYLRVTPPWKITDPHNPGFVAENFRFEDYDSAESLQEALRTMFPLGTPKEKVDRILHDNQPKFVDKKWGASRIKEGHFYKSGENNVYFYTYTPRLFQINIYNLQFFFDENDRIKEISDHGVPLYNKNFFGEK